MRISLFLAVLLFCCCYNSCSSQEFEPWPDCYYVEGVLRLPYAEINEPFVGWYEAGKNRSRVDYYGTVETYQVGGLSEKEYGYTLKVAPMTTEEVINVKTCFRANGTETSPVGPQALLPDLSDFQVSGTELVNGENCTLWLKVTIVEGRKNTYKLYQNANSGKPVRYEMIGYNSLIGSHYDRYYIDYLQFMPRRSFPSRIFTPSESLTCGGFPGPGDSWHHMNPMREFIHHDDSHIHNEFDEFKKNHGKVYDSDSEHAARITNFKHNFRFIQSKNRQGLTYSLSVNHLADMNDEEMRMMRGRKRLPIQYNGGLPFNKSELSDVTVPPYFDWRPLGAVTPVKDQAVCGSCWSFGTTGCVEGAHFLKTKELVRLSQQELIDCSWGEGNNGCDGGEDFRSYQWIMKHGLAKEEDYGGYLGQDGYCKMKSVKPTAFMKGYVNITSGDVEAFKSAMIKFGPLSVGIDAAHKSLSFYSNGVYYEPDCGRTIESIDHAVLAVGYGTLNGENYWIIKNSWSTYWGNDGYVFMSQKNNNCGVTTASTYVIM